MSEAQLFEMLSQIETTTYLEVHPVRAGAEIKEVRKGGCWYCRDLGLSPHSTKQPLNLDFPETSRSPFSSTSRTAV